MTKELCFVCLLVALAPVSPGSRMTRKPRDYIDLSYWLNDQTQMWPGHMPFNMTTLHIRGLGSRVIQSEAVVVSSHFSTHMDAPRHFSPVGWTVSEIPKENLYGPGVVVNVEEKAALCPNYAVTKEDIQEHEAKHGKIPDAAIVFFNTGWGKHWNNTEKYLGTTSKDLSLLAYPGLGRDGAEFLVNERNIVGIGLDSIALDSANNTNFDTHLVLADANRWGIEATANLHLLPPNGFEVYVFPLKLENASGASARVVAFV